MMTRCIGTASNTDTALPITLAMHSVGSDRSELNLEYAEAIAIVEQRPELAALLADVHHLIERVPAPARWIFFIFWTSVLADLLGAPQVAAELRTVLVRLLGG